MGEILQEQQLGLTTEQTTALRGLKVAIKPSVWRFWQEAMNEGVEVVEVPVARVEFDENGDPVAFGVRRSAMLQTIEENGDPLHNSAEAVGIEPERILMFTADGQDHWYWPTPKQSDLPGDPFDVPYI